MNRRPEVPPDPLKAACPSRDVVALLGSKWVLLVITVLREGPQRNGGLLRSIDGLSQKVLTETVRKMERFGIVQRRDMVDVRRKVEYALTPVGQSLARALEPLDAWVRENAFRVAGSVGGKTGSLEGGPASR